MAAVLTNTGIARYQNAMNGGVHTPPQYVGWGTGSTPADATDTGLETPAAEDRVSGAKSLDTTTVANDTYKVIATITSASPQTISEVILNDASTSGNTYVRGVFTGIPLATNDSIQFTVKMILAQP